MYAYVGRPGQRAAYYDQDGDWDHATQEWVTKGPVTKPRELAYWRKHPSLHGYMEQLWLRKIRIPLYGQDQFIEDKHPPGMFNGVELELTWDDLVDLEDAVRNKKLPQTSGYFFGDCASEHYYDSDLKFINDAKAEIFIGLKVFYNSSW